VASARAQDTNIFFGGTSGAYRPSGGVPAGGTYYVPGYPGSYFGHGFDFGRGYAGVPFSYVGSLPYPGGGNYVGGTYPAYSGGFGVPPMPQGGYPPFSGGTP